MKQIFLFLLLSLLLCPALPGSCAETAPDITARAEFHVKWRENDLPNLMDGNYQTEWRSQDKDRAVIEITLPAAQPCHGLYALIGSELDNLVIEQEKGGAWAPLPLQEERFNTMYLPLDGITHLRLRTIKGELRLMELRLYGPGEPPQNVVRFTETADKADLMILACHPDDDVLWMGGLMPIYAGQLGMKVQMAYMTALYPFRRCEAMDALWFLGVRQGPVFLGLPDRGGITYWQATELWGGREQTAQMIARLIRQYRPEVLVTQDAKGEYGHTQHRAMSAACTLAVKMAADPHVRALRDLPPWDVKKYYIHLYEEDSLTLDMELPLSAFGGRNAFELAQEAFRLHVSQQPSRFVMELNGPNDMRKYGLAHTTVGPDEAHIGLFEHLDKLYERELVLWEPSKI
ncbi:MAG: PIG-L family deacetylase [Clostridia bacterium]|nr:PIG-L family deacetylase [Clostridia bacterium]